MAAKYDPEKAKKLNENTYQGLRELPSVMYDQAKNIGESSLYNTSQSQLNNERRLSDESNQQVMETMRGWFGGNKNQQQNIPTPSQTQNTIQQSNPEINQQQNQPSVPQQQPQQSLSGLNQNAAKLNGNPDTTGWAGSDIAKANHFSTFGNKWNPSMNTPGLTSFDIPQQQQQNLKAVQNVQRQPQTTQVIRDGQTLNQSFTSDGNGGYNSRMYDAAGNELTRADQEQMRLMASAQRLIDHSMPAQNASSQYANEQAVRALNALSGLKGIPTTSDVQKDSAAIRKMDTDTSLAPGLANSEIGLRGAQANRYNVESQYMPQRFAMEQQAHNTESKYKQAQIDNLNRKQGITGRDLAALEKVELDRRIAFNEAYNSAIMNNPKIDKNALRRDLERQFGLNKAQRRSATEFQN